MHNKGVCYMYLKDSEKVRKVLYTLFTDGFKLELKFYCAFTVVLYEFCLHVISSLMMCVCFFKVCYYNPHMSI